MINTGEWIRQWAQVRPGKTAVIDNGIPCTYGELNGRINRLICLFLSLGLKKGGRVAVLLYNSRPYLEIFFALSRLGAILVPLNWRLSVSELTFIVDDSGSRLLIFDTSFADNVEKLKASTGLEVFISCGPSPTEEAAPLIAEAIDYESSLRAHPATEPELPEQAGDGDPHIIMYTSGTTGVPKGAVLSHRKTFFNVLNSDMLFGLSTNDVAIVVRPLFHSGGLIIGSAPFLYKGGTVILKRRFTPTEILEMVERYRVTVLELPAAAYQFILNECRIQDYDLSSLKGCFTGGERVPVHLLRALAEKGLAVSQIYGLTEASTLLWLPMDKAREKMGSVGRPVIHGDVKIINKHGKQVRPGESGEIIVRGPIVMNGYWNRPEETDRAIRDGWLHTGDLARVDEEGFAYIVDRKKDMFISGGENVYPAEVEKIMLGHPKVADVAVVGVDDEKWGEAGKAFVVPKAGVQIEAGEIFDFLKDRLAKYKIPTYVEFVAALPRTGSGKIRKYLLKGRKGK
jgi:fatty-acyl-CoA synthase